MKSLLKSSDHRRLELIELLLELSDWIKIGDLADKLNSSVRIIKDDITFFRDSNDTVVIETSHLGVRMTMDQTSGIKDYYRSVLENSLPFQILKEIFFDETLSVGDLATNLYTSASTIYRTVEQINDFFSKYDCRVETNPCHFIGDENYIRNFYRAYFKETSTALEWPFDDYDEQKLDKAFDTILSFLSKQSELDKTYMDFAFSEQVKLIIIVNIVRYEHGHLVDTTNIETTLFKSVFNIPKLFALPKKMKYIRDKPLTSEYIYQVFYPYFKEGMAFDKKTLNKLRKKNTDVNNALSFLEESLSKIAKDIGIDIELEELVIAVYGTTYLEEDDPNAHYILYNRNKNFSEALKQNTSYLYNALYEAVAGYRLRVGRDLNEDKINSLIHVIFTNWENLLADLYTKYQRVSILVLSDGHYSHAKMIQNLLSFELRNNLDIQVYRQGKISDVFLQNYDCELIISTFKLPEFDNKETLVINHFPTFNDINRIETLVSQIMADKTKTVENILTVKSNKEEAS